MSPIRRILRKLEPYLLQFYRKLLQPPPPNLEGDRYIEYSWIAANMPKGRGEALDFGCGPSYMGLLAARKGFKVTALDLEPVNWYYTHPDLKFIQGDILKADFPSEHFNLVVNCSAIEHVGLAGRYGVTEEKPDGDLEAMRVLRNIMKKSGVMLSTIPVGKDKVFSFLHRVYGETRLPRLLDGYEVVKKEFWIKDGSNRWICVDEAEALRKEPLVHCYGLGLFVLRRPVC